MAEVVAAPLDGGSAPVQDSSAPVEPARPTHIARISNIPPQATVTTLRAFFSQAIEASSFCVFHFSGRGGEAGPHACFVRLAPGRLASVVETYHGKQFVDEGGTFVGHVCRMEAVPAGTQVPCAPKPDVPYENRASKKKRGRGVVLWDGKAGSGAASVDVAAVKDLHPPAVLPQGNVGTPTKVLRDLISECRLPTSALRGLGLTFLMRRRAGRGVFSAVPFVYPELPPPQGPVFKVPKPPKPASVPAAAPYAPQHRPPRASSSPEATARRQRYETRADKVYGRPAEHGAGGDRGADSDSDAEEWDRHAAYHDTEKHTFRTHTTERDEYVFEDVVNNPWDKGDNSGLVLYTDALVWEAKKGDFDERTADDRDVELDTVPEAAGYHREGAQAVRDAMLHRNGLRPPSDSESDDGGLGSGMAGTADGRNGYFSVAGKQVCGDHEADVEAEAPPGKRQRRRKPPRSVGRALLTGMGWAPGRGLGKGGRGMVTPLQPEAPRFREGLGFVDTRAALRQARRRERAARAAAPHRTVITTAADHKAALRVAAVAAAADTGGLFAGDTEADREIKFVRGANDK